MDEKTAFLELSALLTGVAEIAAKPEDVPVGDEYLRRLRGVFGASLSNLLGAYIRLASVTPKPPDDTLLSTLRASTEFNTHKLVAAQIVNIWYFSQFRPAEGASFLDGGFYEEGKVWPIIRAHPIGFSHLPHGYWTRSPERNPT
jgi:hypothetical protein